MHLQIIGDFDKERELYFYMIKKILILCSFLFLLIGCGEKESEHTQKEKEFVVVTSFYPVTVLTQEITKGIPGVTVQNMAQSQTGCLHDYQLTTEDMKTLDKAGLFIINGGGMEHFENALQQFPALNIVDTSANTTMVPTSQGHEGHDEHEEETWNSHIWLSPDNAAIQAENIKNALCDADPQNSQQYEENAKDFIQKLEPLRKGFAELNFHQQPVGIFHEGFDYFAQMGKMEAAIALFSDENNTPSAKELSEAIDESREKGITLLFAAEDAGKVTAEAIAQETGAKVIVLNPVTGGTLEADAYLKAMDSNLKKLQEAEKNEYTQ